MSDKILSVLVPSTTMSRPPAGAESKPQMSPRDGKYAMIQFQICPNMCYAVW